LLFFTRWESGRLDEKKYFVLSIGKIAQWPLPGLRVVA
jgi:hypothetical protein